MIESKTDIVKDITRWRAMPPNLAASVIRFYSHYTRKEGPGSGLYESELIDALTPAPALRREVTRRLNSGYAQKISVHENLPEFNLRKSNKTRNKLKNKVLAIRRFGFLKLGEQP